MHRPLTLGLVLLLLTLIAGCGSSRARTTHAPDLLVLTEARALELIAEVLAEHGVARSAGWRVRVGPETELDVDVRLAGTRFGIEWMSPQDRVDLGDAIPGPASGNRMRLVPGMEPEASARIFVLEASSFRYTNERELVQRGQPGALDTESRLRREVTDFLEYVRGQGTAP